MTIAVTNDDGYTEGAMILLRVAKKHGDAYAILPSQQKSAIGAAITLHKPLRFIEHDKDVYTLSGTPGDCSLFAINSKKLPKPDLILSGINWGDNTGISSLLSSGTNGACWKSAIYGVPAISFSLYRGKYDRHDWMKKEKWHSELLEKKVEEVYSLLKSKLSKHSFFVVNFPELDALESAKPVFAKKMQMKTFVANIEEKHDPYGHNYYWIYGKRLDEHEKDTDMYEISVNGNISIKEVSLTDIFR